MSIETFDCPAVPPFVVNVPTQPGPVSCPPTSTPGFTGTVTVVTSVTCNSDNQIVVVTETWTFKGGILQTAT